MTKDKNKQPRVPLKLVSLRLPVQVIKFHNGSTISMRQVLIDHMLNTISEAE